MSLSNEGVASGRLPSEPIALIQALASRLARRLRLTLVERDEIERDLRAGRGRSAPSLKPKSQPKPLSDSK